MGNDKNKSKEQEFIIDTKEAVIEKDNEINERINRLFGESSKEEIKDIKDYDPKELATARKKLLFLFVGVIIAGVVIIVLLFNPIDFEFDKQNEDEPIQEEHNNNNEQTPNYPIELNLTDDLVINLHQKITFEASDFEEIDLFPLYSNETITFNDVPNNIKIFFMKNDEEFATLLIDNGVGEFVKSCASNDISIAKEEFDKVLKDIFGPNATVNYDTINYDFTIDEETSKKITLSFSEDKYIVKCNEYKDSDIIRYIQQDLVKAVETQTEIELYQKVVFISLKDKIGVYKEPTLTTLITDDKTAEFDDYIGKGNTYKYVFAKDNGTYHLSRIELVKEDN